ncbi:MAG TPA: zinc-ribbon domain-containing protein [Candidatus Acidoferrales bacterium]|nr:zinc-ribbon domain-containing protein [Candidatus Acidoferrales bacterium]
MANCTKCGAELSAGSAFCGECGQPLNVLGTGAVGSVSAAAAPATTASGAVSSGAGLTMNLAAALSYALGLITGILFLAIEPFKNDKFVRFHAMQSILFSAAVIVFSIVWSILAGILVGIAGYWVLTIDVPLRLLVGLAIFVLWLYLMFQAYSQREYKLPWIGDLAAKQLK